MGSAKVYSWDDANAPTLNGTRGSLLNLLDAVLVNGYGPKASLGWSLAYTATNKRVYRSQGNAMFYRFDSASTTGAQNTNVSGFESMSDVDTGTGRFPASGTNLFAVASNTADTTVRPWRIIGDDKGFYFFSWYSNTTTPVNTKNNALGWYIGDIVSIIPGDVYNSGLIGLYTSEGAYPASYLSTFDTGGKYICRNKDGAAGAVTCGFKGQSWGVQSAMGSSYSGAYPLSYPYYGQFLYSRPMLCDTGSAQTPRGFTPGLFYPHHAQPLNNFETISTIDGLSLTAFCIYEASNNLCQILLDLNNFRP
jgi:hypothetical protein